MLNVDKALLFGQTIKATRIESEVETRTYVKKLSVHLNTWLAWERGEEFPKKRQLGAMAVMLKMDLAILTRIWETSIKADKEILAFPKSGKGRRMNGHNIELPCVGDCGRSIRPKAGHL